MDPHVHRSSIPLPPSQLCRQEKCSVLGPTSTCHAKVYRNTKPGVLGEMWCNRFLSVEKVIRATSPTCCPYCILTQDRCSVCCSIVEHILEHVATGTITTILKIFNVKLQRAHTLVQRSDLRRKLSSLKFNGGRVIKNPGSVILNFDSQETVSVSPNITTK